MKMVEVDNRVIDDHVREIYGRVTYTHKTHEKCADILESRAAVFRNVQIALSALTTTGFVAAVLGVGSFAVVAGAFLSAAMFFVSNYTKVEDMGGAAQQHKASALQLWWIREKCAALLAHIKIGDRPLDDLVRLRDEMLSELYRIYTGAPRTSSKAYQAARKALQEQEEMTFSVDELDKMLPEALRRG